MRDRAQNAQKNSRKTALYLREKKCWKKYNRVCASWKGEARKHKMQESRTDKKKWIFVTVGKPAKKMSVFTDYSTAVFFNNSEMLFWHEAWTKNIFFLNMKKCSITQERRVM